MKLEGKVAIITGAGSGVGRASALLFAREGARVVVADIVAKDGEETVGAIRDTGGEAIFVRADVSRAADVEAMVKAAVDRYGRLDILYNNAGIDIPTACSVLEATEEQWDRTIDVNLKGVFLGCKYAVPEMLKGGGGVIVNTGSIAGLVGIPGEAPYCASKGGVVILTKQVALDYARQGIRVNCVCPGTIDTAMRDRREWMDDAARQRRLHWADVQPMGRMASIDEIAKAALFLACDDSSFITGTTLVVDGGFTAQ